ncbi:thioredoxin [Bacillus phage YungSlug]|nr:thioredoxin [Bacillus phage YungSlug]
MVKAIKFEKNGCKPCEVVGEYIKNNGLTDKVEVVNIFEKPETAIKYGVMGVPAFMVVDEDGKELERVVGQNTDAIADLIEKYNI